MNKVKELRAQIKMKVVTAKDEQGYDPDPPRCFTCVYCRRNRNKCPCMPHSDVLMCTFGNFKINPAGLCDKWHGRDGTKLEGADD
jgi:hypothetical protein